MHNDTKIYVKNPFKMINGGINSEQILYNKLVTIFYKISKF